MTGPLLAGAVAGLGVYLLVLALFRPAPGIGTRLARLEAARSPAGRRMLRDPEQGDQREDGVDRLRARIGARLELWADARGWRLPRLRTDLDVLGRPLGVHLAGKLMYAVGALIWMPLLWTALRLFGIGLPPAIPVGLGLGLAAIAFFLPDAQVHGEAQQRRKDFRHVMGSFLDLVAMNLAGGRGLPEALLASAGVGDHWAMARIRQALSGARLVGMTPWQALGRLGEEIGVEELRDLAGALTLAGDEGAKIRSSLSARAESMRRKELAEAAGSAAERSQSMLIAQLLLVTAFLVFLSFPAAWNILHNT